MKVINVESGFLMYQKIFKQLIGNHSVLIIWQVDSNGGRKVGECSLQSFHLESQKFHCQLSASFEFDQGLPLFFYIEIDQMIFKTSIIEMKDLGVTCSLPAEIKMLEGPDLTIVHGVKESISTLWKSNRLSAVPDNLGSTYLVKSMSERSTRDQEFLNQEFSPTLDEEDKLFADKRESPRARPKVDKWVKVKVGPDSVIHSLKLFDLSRGGMGFISYDVDLFPKGSDVYVVGFDQFDLDDPLIGKIMGHRLVDGSQIEFKIGIKFNDGQD